MEFKQTILFLLCQFVYVIPYSQTISDSAITPNKFNERNTWLHKELKPVLITAGYTGLTFFCYRFLDNGIEDGVEHHQDRVIANVSQAIGHAGLGVTQTGIVVATAIISLISKDKKLEKAAILLAGSHLINDLVTNESKITFQRHRPYTDDPYNAFDWRGGPRTNNSFVSAHTSNAFCTATVFAICFPQHKWIPIVAYSIAGLVGLSRIYDNAHWTSDVLAGAAVGFVSAHVTNILYNHLSKRWSFLPREVNGQYELDLKYAIY